MVTKLAAHYIKQLEKEGWQYLYDQDRVYGDIPQKSGVYCFVRYDLINDLAEVIYVGKTKNFSVRLKPWHRIENLFDNSFGYLFCYIMETEKQDDLEIELIKRFSPAYNIQHNPKIKRKIVYEYGS